jgi:protein SCO1/2
MRTIPVACLLGWAIGIGACRPAPSERVYRLQGQVLSVASDRQEATIKHEEIKGLMPAMTMPYRVKEAQALEALRPGNLIDARLIIEENDAYLTAVRKVGDAPLEAPPADAPAEASSGFELLKPGDAVPDAAFLDQDGRSRAFSSFKGATVVMTFIYTTCPLPMFCPLMDRHFATIQARLRDEPPPGDVQLVSVSFDPLTDTPPVLKGHARELEADPERWTFLTGDRDETDRFAARFGVSVARALNDPRDISHNLRTAIVDADGRLVKVYMGNAWTPEQILGDLKALAAAR